MRVLFITATRVGDAVLTTGLLEHLRRRHAGARISVACGAPAAPLFRALPGLERVHVLTKRRPGLHWLALWRETVKLRWDIVVDLRRTVVPYFLLAERRVRAPRAQPGRHRVVEVAAALDLAEAPAPCLWLSEADHDHAARLVPAGNPVLAVGPAANWRGKQWRAERFAELVQRLTAPAGILP